MAPQLAPAGSSSYVSNTLHVGDGTWDQGRDTFLLPNLVGLNFATMRYNGMGNRFAGLAGYKTLIKGHAVLAGITYLAIVPAAILIARFMYSKPRWALRLHIWLQIMTIILTTVVIILGFLAVGPSRRFTNPHHGIGLAIYVLVLVQAIGGWYVRARERGKTRSRLPIKVMLHQWSGRFIALLGIAQVPLGLTLYGSPLFLFVLYALYMAILVLLYFVLTYKHEGQVGLDGGSSYFSRSEVVPDRADHRHSRLAGLAASGAAGAAIAGLMGHRNRSKSRSRVDVVGSHRPSASYIDEEKHSEYTDAHRGGWKNRLLKVGAVGGALAIARGIFKKKDSTSTSYSYSTTEDSFSRVEDGRAPESPGRTARIDRPHQPNKLRRHRSRSADSLSSRTSVTGAGHHNSHKVRDGVATLGALGFITSAWRNRKESKEQKRLEAIRQRELEEERIARKESQRKRYTGDGFPGRAGRRGSLTETMTSVSGVQGASRHHHGVPGPEGGRATIAAVDGARTSGPSVSGLPPPPRGSGPDMMAGGLAGSVPSLAGPPPARGSGLSMSHNLAGPPDIPAAAPGPMVGSSAQQALRSGESVNSPPVSVKVKMHNDGRHVTLRRLNEQEAAAEKEARRKERHGKHRKHRHGDSVSSLSGGETGGDRWRRTEARERRQAEEMQKEKERDAQRRAEVGTAGLPPPPPIGGGFGGSPPSVGSPGTVTGTYDGTATEASDYANNRRRRRAERARAQERRSGTVDFN